MFSMLIERDHAGKGGGCEMGATIAAADQVSSESRTTGKPQ